MIYFMQHKRCFPGEAGGRVVIGTEKSIPSVIDNITRRDGNRVSPMGFSRGPRARAKHLSRHFRRPGGAVRMFPVILQMEGGATAARAVYERFKHLKVEDHEFLMSADLFAFIRENAEPWTGENAAALGRPKPKHVAEDRVAPVSNGLAGRVKRRPG